MSKIGIITGHDLEIADIISEVKEHFLDTPYGKPSAKVITGKINKKEVIVMKRHGNHNELLW
jgi:5'-methylthioadenosine phosphorylase